MKIYCLIVCGLEILINLAKIIKSEEEIKRVVHLIDFVMYTLMAIFIWKL